MRRGESNVVLDPESMWHLAGLGFDGITGYSPIRMAANSLGLAIQAENFGAAFFGRGAVPSVVIRHPLHMGPEGRDSFRAQFAQLYGHSAGGPHGVAVLDEGMSLDQITIPPEDAQFLETRKFQVTEVARWYRIPPHMLGDLERATLNNIEHQGIEFVVYSLLPWLRRIETQIWLKLLNQNDKRQFYAEFKVQGLARGDQKSRYESYAIGRQWGWLSANDIRRLENMEPIEGGDMYLRPLNMIAADTVMEGM
jgi:HK97 family phage portal protein